VWICSDEEIRRLHREYFGQDTPTNVISFAQREGDYADVEPQMLGDVVISYDTARRDAEEAGGDPEEEVAYLLMHGVLHLLGYDHEGALAHRAAEMEAREAEVWREVMGEREKP
jgi:probable rRNA maturation factor